MICTVTFNPALDYVIRVPDFLPGRTNRSVGEELQVGGKGINVSFILGQLGLESTALGFLAGDTGELLRRRVEAMGVKADFISLPAGSTRINVKLKSGEETELNGKGPDNGARPPAAPPPSRRGWLPGPRSRRCTAPWTEPQRIERNACQN